MQINKFFLIFSFLTSSVIAGPVLPSIFGNHMVLQQDMRIPIWGTGKPGEKIVVQFAGQKKETVVGEKGNWRLTLDPLLASFEPRTLEIGDDLAFTNVLVGEVWLCSGQSNMEWPVKRLTMRKKLIQEATFPEIRLFEIGRAHNSLPQNRFRRKRNWKECTPKNIPDFSSVAYFFGRELKNKLKVPIGLISSNWGGTRIEPWTPRVGFERVPELAYLLNRMINWDPVRPETQKAYKKYLEKLKAWSDYAFSILNVNGIPAPPPLSPFPEGSGHPTKIFNAMIQPLVPYAIRGVIWYQGEANSHNEYHYKNLMNGLITGWRSVWNRADLPFYFVQLAGFGDPNKNPAGGDGFSWIREAQRRTMEYPHTGMACAIDIGSSKNIHPPNKLEVGKRLSVWALAKTYGKDVVFSGPNYKSHRIENSQVRIQFEYAESGLMVAQKFGYDPPLELEEKIKAISIKDDIGRWHWAESKIEGDELVVFAQGVHNPQAVRYCFSGFPVGPLLYNRAGLPANPFTTEE